MEKVSDKILLCLILLSIIVTIFCFTKKFDEFDIRLATIENTLNQQAREMCERSEVVKDLRRSIVRVVGGEAEGSGFAIDEEGSILTNFHVIEFEPSPKIIFPDNTFTTGEILMVDKKSDLAVIKTEKILPPITWGDSDSLEPGDDLIAIGFALGGELPGDVSINVGSLSAKRQFKEEDIAYLQMDRTLVEGVSGGPMTTRCGEVMGINTASLTGLGFAISSESIRDKLRKMEEAEDPLADVENIEFEPDKSPLETVRSFYNYLKIRQLEKAFALLSENFTEGYGFEYWQIGYQSLLDTSVFEINADEKNENIIYVSLTTKDFVDDEIVYRYFKGQWEVREVAGKYLLWDPDIREVESYWDLFVDEEDY